MYLKIAVEKLETIQVKKYNEILDGTLQVTNVTYSSNF